MAAQFDSDYPDLLVEATFVSPVGTVDITDYVEELSTFVGRRRRLDRYESSARLVLRNWDGRFTPGNFFSPYDPGGVGTVRPGVEIRARATWSSVSYPLFRGYVGRWRDRWEMQGVNMLTDVDGVGPHTRLAKWSGRPVTPVGEGELSGARVSRILTAAGAAPFGTSISAGNVMLAATDLSGDGVSQVTDVVDSEGGAFWYDGAGVATFRGRDALVTGSRSNTSQGTFSDASVYFRDAEPESGEDEIINDATFGREGGMPMQVTDAGSISRHGQFSITRSNLPALNDVDMQAVAELAVARYKDPDFRLASITIDPIKVPSLMWPQALGRQIQDRITVSATPLRSGITWADDAFVEAIEHTIRQHSWSTRFSIAPTTAFDGFSAPVFDTGVFDTSRFFY